MSQTARIAFPLAHWEVREAMQSQLARAVRLATYTQNGVPWISVRNTSPLWMPEGLQP